MSPCTKRYDILGIGIGPFNLGLAALCYPIRNLDCLFIDSNPSFNWHPGIMLDHARVQVPFYADLVTLADPTSPFSYLSYLKEQKQMFRFGIGDKYFILRSEYNNYCRWVVNKLPNLVFNNTCVRIEKMGHGYAVFTDSSTYYSRNLVIGIGAVPFLPHHIRTNGKNILHSSDYLYNKKELLGKSSISIIGSGQSGAEIFFDLLHSYQGKLSWFTRSSNFMPMDQSKLSYEMSTPDYTQHFYSLPDEMRKKVLCKQDRFFKGINPTLIDGIYEKLLELTSPHIHLHPSCELMELNDYTIAFRHRELDTIFTHDSEAIIFATGYSNANPDFLKPLLNDLNLNEKGEYSANRNYSLDKENTLFVQNAEQATHGFSAADLSLGPYRNSVIINAIMGKEIYAVESNTCFQTFGLPKN